MSNQEIFATQSEWAKFKWDWWLCVGAKWCSRMSDCCRALPFLIIPNTFAASKSFQCSIQPFELFILPGVLNPKAIWAAFKARKHILWLRNGHFCPVGAQRDSFLHCQLFQPALIRERQWTELDCIHGWQRVEDRMRIRSKYKWIDGNKVKNCEIVHFLFQQYLKYTFRLIMS